MNHDIHDLIADTGLTRQQFLRAVCKHAGIDVPEGSADFGYDDVLSLAGECDMGPQAILHAITEYRR